MDASTALRAWRDRESVSQQSLADRVGVTQTTVAGWETGRRPISRSKLLKVNEVTGIALDVLLRTSPEQAA